MLPLFPPLPLRSLCRSGWQDSGPHPQALHSTSRASLKAEGSPSPSGGAGGGGPTSQCPFSRPGPPIDKVQVFLQPPKAAQLDGDGFFFFAFGGAWVRQVRNGLAGATALLFSLSIFGTWPEWVGPSSSHDKGGRVSRQHFSSRPLLRDVVKRRLSVQKLK